jgi:hypothetical protein
MLSVGEPPSVSEVGMPPTATGSVAPHKVAGNLGSLQPAKVRAGLPMLLLFHSSCTLPSTFKLKRSSCARSTPSRARSCAICASATSGSTRMAICTASASVSLRGSADAVVEVVPSSASAAAAVAAMRARRICIPIIDKGDAARRRR